MSWIQIKLTPRILFQLSLSQSQDLSLVVVT